MGKETEEKKDLEWDKLLHFARQEEMILILINIVTLMSQRRTLYWNVWRILDILERRIQ